MFEIGWTELVLIAVVAIVVIGPKDLPRVMRTIGQWTSKMKRMGRDFQGQFNEALREADLADVKKEVESIAAINPLAGVRREMSKMEAGIREGLDKPAAKVAVAAPVPATPVPTTAPATVPEAVPEPKAET